LCGAARPFEGGTDGDLDVVQPIGPAGASPAFDPAIPVHDSGSCVPWSQRSAQAFVPASDDGGQAVAARLASVANQALGSWVGLVTSPWGQWDVTITFTADGHYVAYGYNLSEVGPANPPAFYYGTDVGCDSLKQWRLTSAAADGSVQGQIDISFGGPTSCSLPTWQGELSGFALDATDNRLHFAFSRSDGYGPVVYDLWRVCGK
jgi:hypothetical protein